MGVITIILISIGLAMDAFAVSISNGMCFKEFKRKDAFATALTFGLFQGIMPVLGYLVGSAFLDTISFLDHWIALFLLGAIGINMISEGIKAYKNPNESCKTTAFSIKLLLVQGVATSIDALAVGISFAVTKTNIGIAALSIGVITFCCCLLGTFLGKRFDKLFKDKAEIFGGCILILIGLKIFIEHMFF